jgi:hypothetical protein
MGVELLMTRRDSTTDDAWATQKKRSDELRAAETVSGNLGVA